MQMFGFEFSPLLFTVAYLLHWQSGLREDCLGNSELYCGCWSVSGKFAHSRAILRMISVSGKFAIGKHL
ncbi:hypothetical protein Leryth_025278 [Lithospermum erythrorhizon]|nr:hypothetical protein Leryth_025278 [Lithospermum erythrorhizon]